MNTQTAAAPVLFVSLGTSPAIVPEAFLMEGVNFQAVHVLTTERPEIQPVLDFFNQHAPDIALTISRVAGFEDFSSEEDHFRFEEVLYRWLLEAKIRPESRYVCLSGGFKTMSAAMQKAATVLGAAQVFHVLADSCCTGPNGESRFPTTHQELIAAGANGHLHWIQLGPEDGWPQLRSARPEDYPLEIKSENDRVRRIQAADPRFRMRLRDLVERSHRIAESWDQLHDLPFAELATWPKNALNWLRQPLDPRALGDRQWVADLPKIELHCHLGGFATEGGLLRQIRSSADEAGQLPDIKTIPRPADWPNPANPIGLEAYRKLGDNNGSALLKDPGCLRRQCELLYQHLQEQKVTYAEIRCSPANYATRGSRSPWDVLADLRNTFQHCMTHTGPATRCNSAPPSCHVNLIVIGTRQTGGDFRAGISRHLALAVTAAEHWQSPEECRVVGVDLAGYEDVTTRAHYFRDEFTAVHRCGLALTAHAGENDDAEGIWRAVFDLNTRRIGHALSLAQSPELLGSVVDRGVGIEMCPYANLQIRGFPLDTDPPEKSTAHYPLLEYLVKGARVTVNTDNIGISAATLTDNLLLAARLCPGLTRLDILKLQRNALETAFITAGFRGEIIKFFSRAIPHP